MIQREVRVQEGAVLDLREAMTFYERQKKNLGDYFVDSLIVDLESLSFYAGIHSKKFGCFRMCAKRFPFAIYYDIVEDVVQVIGVLHMKRRPAWNRNILKIRRR